MECFLLNVTGPDLRETYSGATFTDGASAECPGTAIRQNDPAIYIDLCIPDILEMRCHLNASCYIEIQYS